MRSVTSDEALRRVAAFGLPSIDPAPFTVDSPDRLLQLAEAQRVGVRLDRAVAAGIVVYDDEGWRTRCRDRGIAAAETTLAAHAAAMAVGAVMERSGIRYAVIKGCATGPLDYDDPVSRFSTDVDIVVLPDDLDATVAKLGTRTDVPRNARWHRRFGHAITVAGPTGVEVDIHVRVNHGYVGLAVPITEFLQSTDTYELAGKTLYTVDRVSRLLLAAIHAGGVHPSLHAERDVPQLAVRGAADWEEAADRARRWHVDGFFARGVTHSWERLGLAPHDLSEWARRHRSQGKQRLATRFTGARSQVVAGPLALPVRRWPGYIGPLLAPRREYVAHGGKDRAARFRIVRNELRDVGRRSR